MGFETGNGGIVTDGLILYYDVNSPKCFRGEKATNLIDSTAANCDGNAGGYYYGVVENANYEKGYKSFKVTTVANNGVPDGIIIGDGTLRAIGAYACSARVWCPKGKELRMGFRFYPQGEDATIVINGNSEWQLAYYPYNLPLVTNQATNLQIQIIQVPGGADDAFSFWVREPMMNTGSYVKPFVNGSRLSNSITGSGGLIDLTISSSNGFNADISSYVTFDSRSFYFATNTSGVDVPISIPSTVEPLYSATTGSFTLDCWFKILGDPPGTNNGYLFGRRGYHNGLYSTKGSSTTISSLIWFRDDTTSNSITFTVASNTWNHGVVSVDHKSKIIYTYKNGFLMGSVNYTKELKDYGTAPYFMGGGGPDYCSNSKIENCKLYNRALSSGEVMKNFMAHKTFYGV